MEHLAVGALLYKQKETKGRFGTVSSGRGSRRTGQLARHPVRFSLRGWSLERKPLTFDLGPSIVLNDSLRGHFENGAVENALYARLKVRVAYL